MATTFTGEYRPAGSSGAWTPLFSGVSALFFDWAWAGSVPPGDYSLRIKATEDGADSAWSTTTFTAPWMPSALLVVGNSGALTAEDTALQARLVALGYAVTVADDSAPAPATAPPLIVVSDSCTASNVGTRYRDTTAGVIVCGRALWTSTTSALTSASSSTETSTNIYVANAAHPLAAGLAGGLNTVYPGGGARNYADVAEPAAQVVVKTGNNSRAVIFGYETGATMAGGIGAAGRRVGWGLISFPSLNAAGLALFDAAVSWVRTLAPPVAGFTVETDGLAVTCTSTATDDSGVVLTEYDFGTGDGFGTANTHIYDEAANYTITQRVTDADGLQATDDRPVSVAPPATPPDITYRLRIYEADDVTVMAEVSTDPAHPHPYLIAPDGLSEQEVDFARGAASLSQVQVGLIDVPTVPGDQGSGYVTEMLGDNLMGHRFQLHALRPAGETLVINGVCSSVALRDSYSGYTSVARDIRERGRKRKAFISAARRDETGAVVDAPCVWPRGRLAAYGQHATGYLIPAVTPATGAYTPHPFTLSAVVQFPDVDRANVPLARVFTPMMRKAVEAARVESLDGRISLLWRYAGGGPWEELKGVRPMLETLVGTAVLPTGKKLDVQYVSQLWFDWPSLDYEPKPEGLTPSLDVVLIWTGPPSKDYPFRWEGPAGDLIAELADGVHSWSWDTGAPPPASSRLWYDASALSALTVPLRLTQDEVVDDLRSWEESNVYAAAGAAPTLNQSGALSPARLDLPDAAAVLLELTDANCIPSPGWEHTAADAVNKVEVTYVREYGVSENADPLQEVSTGDGVAYQSVTVRVQDAASIAMIGERLLEYKPATLRAIGSPDGGPLNGDAADEGPHQHAKWLAQHALDRFVDGGQYYTVRALRSDPAVEASKVGDWALEGTSWKPDFATRRRGANRLAQIVRRRDENPSVAVLGLIDAGPANQPVGQPTVGAVTASDDGVVSIAITALAAGSEAAMYYAISPTLPLTTSPLWTFAAPRLTAPGTRATPALPAGATVWVRARGEAPGRRPSAYTNATSVTLPQTPRIISAQVFPGEDLLTWTVNAYVLGLRITATKNGVALPTLNVSAADGEVVLPYHAYTGDVIEIVLEPWTGWTGSNVSGTAGPNFTLTWSGAELPPPGHYDIGRVYIDASLSTATHWALMWEQGDGVEDTYGAALTFDTSGPSGETEDALISARALITPPLMVPKPMKSPQFSHALIEPRWTDADTAVQVHGVRVWYPVYPQPSYAPKFLLFDVVDQTLKLIGENIASYHAERLNPPSGGEWSRDVDGTSASIATGIPAAETWEVAVTGYTDPIAYRSGSTLTVTENRVVRGASVIAEPVFDSITATPPLNLSRNVPLSFTLKDPIPAGLTLSMYERHTMGNEPTTEWVEITSALSPALVAPVAGATQNTVYEVGAFFRRDDTQNWLVTFEFRVEARDSGGNLVDAMADPATWAIIEIE